MKTGIVVSAFVALASISTADAQTVQAPYNANYTATNLGAVPGLPANYGGLAFHPSNANILLMGGHSESASGAIYQVNVVRDAQQHVIGFSGTPTLFATAAGVDGGVAVGPGNVVFATGYSLNVLHEIPPGHTAPTKSIALASIGIPGSVGSCQIIPTGYVNAGKLAIVTYGGTSFYIATLTPDGSGTFDLTNVSAATTLGSGLEGILYPPAGSPLFVNYGNVLISEYNAQAIAVYDLDVNGKPIPITRKVFVSGVAGAEGAAIDPVTGDFLFSTWGTNKVISVHGFAVPSCTGGSVPYGTGTPGKGGFVPALAVLGTPCIGNALSALQLNQGLGGALCVLFTGLSSAAIPAPSFGGTIYVNPTLVSAFLLAGSAGVAGAGNFAANLLIPNDANVVGLNVYLQAILADAAASHGHSFTAGLQVTIG